MIAFFVVLRVMSIVIFIFKPDDIVNYFMLLHVTVDICVNDLNRKIKFESLK